MRKGILNRQFSIFNYQWGHRAHSWTVKPHHKSLDWIFSFRFWLYNGYHRSCAGFFQVCAESIIVLVRRTCPFPSGMAHFSRCFSGILSQSQSGNWYPVLQNVSFNPESISHVNSHSFNHVILCNDLLWLSVRLFYKIANITGPSIAQMDYFKHHSNKRPYPSGSRHHIFSKWTEKRFPWQLKFWFSPFFFFLQ